MSSTNQQAEDYRLKTTSNKLHLLGERCKLTHEQQLNGRLFRSKEFAPVFYMNESEQFLRSSLPLGHGPGGWIGRNKLCLALSWTTGLACSRTRAGCWVFIVQHVIITLLHSEQMSQYRSTCSEDPEYLIKRWAQSSVLGLHSMSLSPSYALHIT